VTYLLDTNTFLWASGAPRALSGRARRICQSSAARRVVSAASLWEIAMKCSTGKLAIFNPTATLPVWLANLEARVLPVGEAHAYAAYGLPLIHKDPFDRMLVAQAVSEDLTVVTGDEIIQRYPVKWVW